MNFKNMLIYMYIQFIYAIGKCFSCSLVCGSDGAAEAATDRFIRQVHVRLQSQLNPISAIRYWNCDPGSYGKAAADQMQRSLTLWSTNFIRHFLSSDKDH